MLLKEFLNKFNSQNWAKGFFMSAEVDVNSTSDAPKALYILRYNGATVGTYTTDTLLNSSAEVLNLIPVEEKETVELDEENIIEEENNEDSIEE